jgi:cytoplasmic polyadenylation element-binding protein
MFNQQPINKGGWPVPLIVTSDEDDDKTPVASESVAEALRNTPKKDDAAAVQGQTPAVRLQPQKSNTSTPRTNSTFQEEVISPATNATGSSLLTDTSATSGISSETDEMAASAGDGLSYWRQVLAQQQKFQQQKSQMPPSITEEGHADANQRHLLSTKSQDKAVPQSVASAVSSVASQQDDLTKVLLAAQKSSSNKPHLADSEYLLNDYFLAQLSVAYQHKMQQEMLASLLQSSVKPDSALLSPDLQHLVLRQELLRNIATSNSLGLTSSVGGLASTSGALADTPAQHNQMLINALLNQLQNKQQPQQTLSGNHFNNDSYNMLNAARAAGVTNPLSLLSVEQLTELLNTNTHQQQRLAAHSAGLENRLLPSGSADLATNNIVRYYKSIMGPKEIEIEKAAFSYRNSANSVAQRCEAAYHWSGTVPRRSLRSEMYSPKVFLGGVPWDITSEELAFTFSMFGKCSISWPHKDSAPSRSISPRGYCYVIFESEISVKYLLNSCMVDNVKGATFFRLNNPKFRTKDVQVIPWSTSDSIYSKSNNANPDAKKTVFVGALHGMITADALATIMEDLFGTVIYAALDTDKYKYPIGSGRVTFETSKSYMRAVTANFVDVRTPKFTKTIQIDPYLEDAFCNHCFWFPGIYFCRAFECFRYFCPSCWHDWHIKAETLYSHKPLRRSFKAVYNQQQMHQSIGNNSELASLTSSLLNPTEWNATDNTTTALIEQLMQSHRAAASAGTAGDLPK